MQVLLVLVFGLLSIVAAKTLSRPSQSQVIISIVAGSFILRLLMHVFIMRSVAFFSHGVAGGDCNIYESMGEIICTMWRMDGFQYITPEILPDIKSVSLICNLYACVTYICGPGSSIASTSIVAFIACLVCLVMYRFALRLGASERSAFGVFVVTILGPSFIYHTSDMYKDGINALLVVTSLYLALSTAKQFSVGKLALLIPVLTALWEVRSYMVFLCLVPLPMAFLGSKRSLSLGRIIGVFMLVAAIGVLVVYGAVKSIATQAEAQFDRATDAGARSFNADMGASGVTFSGDTGSPWAAIGPKLIYTLFSPFPWMGGSIGLQLGKIDTLIWYYIVFSAIGSARLMWNNDRRTLLLLLLFLGSGFLAYATTMSNIGLIFRQRMPLVMITTVLASVYWTHRERMKSQQSVVREPLVALAVRPPA
jgi:hypothetical protein